MPLLTVDLEADGLVARDGSGNRVLSRTRRGENASLDEAVQMLTGAHRPAPPDNPAPRDDQGRYTGRKTMLRRDFETLGTRDKYKLMRDAGVTIVD
jgi:hypothetical protein